MHGNKSLRHDGFDIIENMISDDDIDAILGDIENVPRSTQGGGIRNIEKKSSVVARFCSRLERFAEHYLTGQAKLVRAIFFNKTPACNWRVNWHQDKTVAVSEQFDAKGWHLWTTKDAVIHVQPPIEVLNQMIAVRLHLDASHNENGCLSVMPGSHKLGILKHEAITNYVANNQPLNCVAARGSALVMRPHILHSSSKASAVAQRRVLHLEFSSYRLPGKVKWGSHS